MNTGSCVSLCIQLAIELMGPQRWQRGKFFSRKGAPKVDRWVNILGGFGYFDYGLNSFSRLVTTFLDRHRLHDPAGYGKVQRVQHDLQTFGTGETRASSAFPVELNCAKAGKLAFVHFLVCKYLNFWTCKQMHYLVILGAQVEKWVRNWMRMQCTQLGEHVAFFGCAPSSDTVLCALSDPGKKKPAEQLNNTAETEGRAI